MTNQSITQLASSKQRNTRQLEILKAALNCFIHHGIEATTIEMIREQSGASVGSIYHHFGNKEKIAAALYKEGLRQFSLQLKLSLKEVTTIEDAIRSIIQTNIEWIIANPDWARFVFRHRHVLKDTEQELLFREETALTHRALFTQLEALPDFKRLRVLPESMYLPVLIGPVHTYARQWLDGLTPLALNELTEDFIRIALKSLLD
ncbi:MAG: TetR/AcrR family transcriptional regulator [Gammaproteobacteria bacterium]|nr:TetR/AcrR family transcriptional regulator [Gammaproteobacteria bacterium]